MCAAVESALAAMLGGFRSMRQTGEDAETVVAVLRAVLERAPGHAAARQDLACVLIERHQHAQAREQVEMLLAAEPDRRDYRTLLANAIVGLGEHERAIELFGALLADGPDEPVARA